MRKALGKGLEALLPQDNSGGTTPISGESLLRIPIESIRPSRLQPRKNFDPERLSELAGSIKEHGLVEPIAVSYDSISNSYELIAGERRLRAAKLAGLTSVDAVIRTPRSDRERLAMALVENLQRDDLNAIETAVAYRQLLTDFGLTQTDLTRVVGKSKSAISNTLRLLELPDSIQKAVQFGELTEGHARALLMVQDGVERNKLFRLIIARHLSVRQVEAMAQQISHGKNLADSPTEEALLAVPAKSPDIQDMEKKLEHAFGTRVSIDVRKDGKSGKINVYFYSLEDFDNILKVIKL